MSRKNKTLVEWLGFDAEFDLNRAQLLGTFLGFIIALLGLALLSVWVIGLVQLVGAMVGLGPFSSDPTGAAIRNLGIVVAAMLGFPFLVWRSVVAQRNAITAEQSQITDRINKAVLGLGSEKISKRIYETPKYQKTGQNWNSDADGNPVPAVRPDGTPIVEREQFEESVPNIEVRLGAIYSLERIANDSDRDYANVMSLLAAYVRENANPRASNVKLREDVQAAVTLITKPKAGRQTILPANRSELTEEIIHGPDFKNANLAYLTAIEANFVGATIDQTSFRNAHLPSCDFRVLSCLTECDWSDAEMTDCKFDFSMLFGVTLSRETNLNGSSFRASILADIDFGNASLGWVDFFGVAFGGCSFSNAKFVFCNFEKADIGTVNFWNASLLGANFSNCTGWEQSQFDEAFGNRGGEGQTILPDGAVYPDHWTDLETLEDGADPLATFDQDYFKWLREGKEAFKELFTQELKGRSRDFAKYTNCA